MPHTLPTYNGITNAMVASQSGYHAASLRRAQGKLWLSTGITVSYNQTLGGGKRLNINNIQYSYSPTAAST